jgi:hypothetical protein
MVLLSLFMQSNCVKGLNYWCSFSVIPDEPMPVMDVFILYHSVEEGSGDQQYMLFPGFIW